MRYNKSRHPTRTCSFHFYTGFAQSRPVRHGSRDTKHTSVPLDSCPCAFPHALVSAATCRHLD
ncbi:hypothetical protein E2C01_075121 [Portunus trituberculatus]|uniref:Uncharacterized protein n=1 Tax=Portunus trituberculatus TaxID=210409 RepID=A0A5B7I5A4_PORTR|nr:hypothetical protein [Portunus trituberculatus]